MNGETDCPECGVREGYCCRPSCACADCCAELDRLDARRERGDADGVEYADPRDYRDDRE